MTSSVQLTNYFLYGYFFFFFFGGGGGELLPSHLFAPEKMFTSVVAGLYNHDMNDCNVIVGKG